MPESVKRNLGCLGWSWSGNTDPILDMTTNFDATQLTTWGERIVNGPNGLKATTKQATTLGAGTPTPSTPTPTPSLTTPPPPTGAYTATYTIAGQWADGFQADVKVTAGAGTIKGWTVTRTYGNGQTVSQTWNATVTSSGPTMTARNVSYNGSLGAARRPSSASSVHGTEQHRADSVVRR